MKMYLQQTKFKKNHQGKVAILLKKKEKKETEDFFKQKKIIL